MTDLVDQKELQDLRKQIPDLYQQEYKRNGRCQGAGIERNSLTGAWRPVYFYFDPDREASDLIEASPSVDSTGLEARTPIQSARIVIPRIRFVPEETLERNSATPNPFEPGMAITRMDRSGHGRLGGFLMDAKKNTRYLLTCEHVVGDRVNDLRGMVVRNRYGEEEPIGTIAALTGIDYAGNSVSHSDAALVKVCNALSSKAKHPSGGPTANIAGQEIGIDVKALNPNASAARLKYIYCTVRVEDEQRTPIFVDVCAAESLGGFGDSGSLVVTGSKAVGLLFAISEPLCWVCDINHVFQKFNADMRCSLQWSTSDSVLT